MATGETFPNEYVVAHISPSEISIIVHIIKQHDVGLNTSVSRIHNFHGFLNPGNCLKPAKTQVVEYFETYVLLSQNPPGETWTETSKTHESRKVHSNYWAYIYVRKIIIKVQTRLHCIII